MTPSIPEAREVVRELRAICTCSWAKIPPRCKTCRAADTIEALLDREELWRKLLWLRHGCERPALYGDDGEMQCSRCGLDFLRQSPQEIEEIWRRKGLAQLAATREAPAPREGEG